MTIERGLTWGALSLEAAVFLERNLFMNTNNLFKTLHFHFLWAFLTKKDPLDVLKYNMDEVPWNPRFHTKTPL